MSHITPIKPSDNLQQELSDKKLEYYRTTLEILDSLSKDVDQRTKTPRLPTGISALDHIIFGLHKKELMVICGRPSHGKSSVALFIAWHLAKLKHRVVFMPLEMSRENTVERIVCMEYGISNFKLRQGDDAERAKFFKCVPDLNSKLLETNLEIIERDGKSIDGIQSTIELFKPDVLFVDHVQKISSKGYSSKYEALSDFMNNIQELAIKYNCSLVVNSQLGRSEEFAKGAGEIEENADCLIHINWKCRKDPEYSDKKEFEISVVKQRHGPCDYCLVNFDGATYQFSDRDYYAEKA